ncbi:MAG: alpha-galactosidase [Litorimonas sp.]
MELIRVTDGPTFALGNDEFTYGLRVTDEGLLEHLHFGPPLERLPDPMARVLRHCTVMLEDGPELTLNELPQEYPTAGRGDYSAPALHLVGPDGSVSDLRYVSHNVVSGKPAPDRLPVSRGNGAQSLIVTLRDAVQGAEVDLHYTVWPQGGVLARRMVVRNVGSENLVLQCAHSASLDLPPADYRVQHLHGSWAREFEAETLPLPTGRFVVDSARGTSGNAHVPYLALMEPDATETAGRCHAVTLLYSGNHRFSAERGEFGRVRLQAGINPFDFDWPLGPGEVFETPEALLATSDSGLGGLSHRWHAFIRDHVVPERFRNAPRPTYLNTWEAAYFDVSEETVLDMAELTADLGVEMLVLDDGWFRGRTDDCRALGDWTADPARFPSGLDALAGRVRAKGLTFGLWLEPEMVSPDSELFRAHPDWVIGVPGRAPSLGRNQLTLDLSRPDVADHLFARLDAVLSPGRIGYVKWDMNRNMTEVGSGARAHRYMLGLYGLLDRITAAYPGVLFEACASGGNRFDLGMLRYMPQGWISDMVDPVGRLSIVNGASHLFPPDVMAAYIGPSPNHQNGRVSSLEARHLAGLPCAAHGLSLNPTDIAEHLDRLRDFVARSKASARNRLGATFHRLRHTANETVWQTVSRDGETVRVVAFQVLNAPNLPQRRIRLRGLDATADYALEDGRTFGGDVLLHVGLPLAPATGDVHAELFELRRIG